MNYIDENYDNITDDVWIEIFTNKYVGDSFLIKYKDKWAGDYFLLKKVSYNKNISMEFIDRYSDILDWENKDMLRGSEELYDDEIEPIA